MRIKTVTLDKEDMKAFSGKIPEEVMESTGGDGYYTIGAVDGKNRILGMAQFCVGTGERGHTEAGLYYIYVEERARLQGIGLQLISSVLSILRKSGIRRLFAFPGKENPVDSFLKKAGFISSGTTFRWKNKKGLFCWMKPT